MAPLVAMAVLEVCTIEALVPGIWLLVMTIAYLTLVPAITQVPQDRFRLPAEPFIFVLAGLGAAARASSVFFFCVLPWVRP